MAAAGSGDGVPVAGAGVSPVAAAASLVGVAPLPLPPCSLWCASPGRASVAIRASTVPTSTVVPTSTTISDRRPAAGDGTSVSILSVEMSTIGSSYSTQSPGSLRQPTIVPSETDTPICGMTTSTVPAALGAGWWELISEELTGGLLHAVDAGQDRLLERGRERDRHVGRRYAAHRAVEVLEAAVGDDRRDLRARRARLVRLVDDQHLARLADRREDRLLVERHERAQVEHLDRRAVEVLGRLERGVHHRAVRDDREVGSFARDAGGERRRVEAVGHLTLHAPVEVLVLEEEDGVVIAHGADQQALGVLGRRRRDHLQPRR